MGFIVQTSPAFNPVQIGPITVKNRFIKAAANENMSRNGLPTAAMLKHHGDLARGGLGLTTVAYIAVSELGRTLPDQIWARRAALPALKKLTEEVHQAGGKICAQITHGGAFVTSIKLDKRPFTSSGGLNKAGMLAGNWLSRDMTQADMDRVKAEFVACAELMREAGFDAVELHMGHGYLLNQFVSPLSNKRKDQYGGSAANRIRYPGQVLAAVKKAVGNDLAVLAKINVIDGVKGGATADDGIVTARALQAAGADMLVLSGGRNVESLQVLFGSSPNLPELKKVLHDQPLTRTAIVLQNLLAPKLAFSPMYFWQHSLKIKQALPDLPMAYLGGVKSLGDVEQALGAGFEAVAMARVLLHDAAFVNNLQSGQVQQSACDNCNACVAYIYHPDGTRCVHHAPNDPALNRQPVA
jgi:2,4-dienoyl-CoA reductase-like NADH-dependent reductase (Old Yellow Enzyme family)